MLAGTASCFNITQEVCFEDLLEEEEQHDH